MYIMFKYGSKSLVLPVNPESLRVHTSSSAQKVNVIGIGQVSVPQDADLKTISVKSFFWKYLFDNDVSRSLVSYFGREGTVGNDLLNRASETRGLSKVTNTASSLNSQFNGAFTDDSKKFKTLIEYIKWFEDWRDSKEPARFTVITLPNEPKAYFDFDVTCESFDYEEKAGEEGDYYYEMELLEYRHYQAKELNGTKTETDAQTGETKQVAKEADKSRLTVKEKVSQIVTKPGETLWTLAKKYGDGEYDSWKQLYNISYNRNIIANNLRDLSGKTLQMPKEWL